MVFNVLIQNKDDHGKNFAFLYDEKEKGYVLSPAFDLTSTPYLYGHEMSANGKDNPSNEDLFAVAREAGIPEEKALEIYEQVSSLIRH